MAQVSVVIVNWNGKHLLQSCLPAVLSQTFDDYEVVVVDNGSRDGSADWVEGGFSTVRVIRCDRNLGFAGGNNRAIRATQSRYVATLNNDAEPAPGWLAELVHALETTTETSSPACTDRGAVGMCASKIVYADRPGILDSCGITVDLAGIGWNRLGGEPDRPDESIPYPVFGPCAGAALYRRTMLDQLGLFDEDYFAYYEDVDLAWRAQRAGWRCLYVPTARVMHRHSSTAREGSPFKGYQLGRNKVWTLIKNYPWPDWLFHLPLILAYDVAAWGSALLRGDSSSLRGRLAALRSWSLFLKKRRQVQSSGEPVSLSVPPNPLLVWGRQRARLARLE